jgi:hypothetical protein
MGARVIPSTLFIIEVTMHYYKILKDQKVIDLASGKSLMYVTYQQKHKILLMCEEVDAMGIISDSDKCYHLKSCLPFPVDDYPTVDVEEITEIEYEQLRDNNLVTADEARMQLLAELMERGVL